MHNIFPISLRTTKIFKFQIYYSKFSFSYGDYHDNKKIYHLITIDITQIIDSTLIPNLYFLILK